MKSLAESRLYTFVDTAWLAGRKVEAIARQLCDGGSDLIQLRAKDSTLDEIKRMAEAILPITEKARVKLVINDHAGIALAVGAGACHLGQEDFFEQGHTQVSQISGCPPALEVGLSTHSPGQAERALAAQASYIAIGPVYLTGTKPKALPVTLELVRWAATHVRIPWFAIGGINLTNLDAVLEAGGRRICVVSAILNRPDVARACQEFKERLASVPL